MRKRCARTLSMLGAILFIELSSSLAAGIPVVRGQLHPPVHELVQGLCVILEGVSSHVQTAQADVRGDGSFEFRDIPTGDYTLLVTDGRGLTVCQHSVTIQDHMPEFENRLPEREFDRGGARSGTVSVTELMYPVRPIARPRAPSRTSAGDIGTCCCRGYGSGLLNPNGGTIRVASIV